MKCILLYTICNHCGLAHASDKLTVNSEASSGPTESWPVDCLALPLSWLYALYRQEVRCPIVSSQQESCSQETIGEPTCGVFMQGENHHLTITMLSKHVVVSTHFWNFLNSNRSMVTTGSGTCVNLITKHSNVSYACWGDRVAILKVSHFLQMNCVVCFGASQWAQAWCVRGGWICPGWDTLWRGISYANTAVSLNLQPLMTGLPACIMRTPAVLERGWRVGLWIGMPDIGRQSTKTSGNYICHYTDPFHCY